MSRLAVWGGYALLLAAAPLGLPDGLGVSLLSELGIAIVLCLSYNLLLGQGGMVSFGHAVYAGAGAYLAIHTLRLLHAGLALPVSLTPLLGGMAGVLVALPLGWISTRRSGVTLAMITWGLGELVWAVALVWPAWFGGEAGVSANRVVGYAPLGLSLGPPLQLYGLIALYAWICTAALYALNCSPWGQLLRAVRDNPQRAAFVGHDPHAVRFSAFVIAAFFAGIAGGLSALHYETVSPEVFGGVRSAQVLLFTYLGGSTVFWGPVLGAALMVLALTLLPAWTPAWQLYLGLMFGAAVLRAPGGLAGLGLSAWQALRRPLHLRARAWQVVATAWMLLALGALVAWVELLYRLNNPDVWPSVWTGLGWPLDARNPLHWLASGGLGAVALLGWRRAQRAGVQRERA